MGEGLQNRNLLYTAVTRAKELLLIFGSGQTIGKMVEACQTDARNSCLTSMLKQMVGSRPAFPSASADNPFQQQEPEPAAADSAPFDAVPF
jgi:ATP-dependent exoDNAse (exonuclease V) beta subunit